MRISDWSSDVCSSDLGAEMRREAGIAEGAAGEGEQQGRGAADQAVMADGLLISGRERAGLGIERRLDGSAGQAPSFAEDRAALHRLGRDRKSTRLNSSH